MCELTSTKTASGIFTKVVAASNAVEVFDIRVHVAVTAERRSRQSGGLCGVGCLARLPGRLLLSQECGRDDCGRLLRDVLVFALGCAAWRRGGRFAASACDDERRDWEDCGGGTRVLASDAVVSRVRRGRVLGGVSRDRGCGGVE
jgi:hypothetical protein